MGDDMLDEVTSESVTLGKLIDSSLREAPPGGNRIPGDDRRYDMDFDLGGQPDAGFAKALDEVMREPAFRASSGVSSGVVSVVSGKLHLRGVRLADVESRLLPAVEAALIRANDVHRAEIVQERLNQQRRSADDKQEAQNRAAFVERMRKRNPS